MQRVPVLFCLIFVLSLSSFAQVVIGAPDIQTVSGDTDDGRKSLIGAIGLSALLPGSGEAYLGNEYRQKVFLTTELTFLAVTGISYILQDHYFKSAHSYASRWAGAGQGPRELEYMELMEQFRSRSGIDGQNSISANQDDYNLNQIRSGRAIDEHYPSTPEYTWDWGTSDNPENTKHWNRYGDILDNYRQSLVVLKASIGALILNRVISAVSVIQYYKSNRKLNVHAAPFVYETSPGVVVMVGF